MTTKLSEQAFLLGPYQSLVGIVTEAAATASPADRPAIVILNAGIIHRVGPSRTSVLLSRALAAAGHIVLRFDLSGIGDSEPRVDGLTSVEGSLADIREALDWLEASRRVRRFVLVGLCSGANHALLYGGGGDPRTVGLVLIDPATPKTPRFYLRHFMPRLFRPRIWYRVLRGRHPMVQGLARRIARHREGGVAEPASRGRPDLQSPEVRAILERSYRGAVDRGVRFLAIFTEALQDKVNYREQVIDAFPGVVFGDRIRLEYFHGADHTFTSEADRSRLFALVAQWIHGAAWAWPGDGATPVPQHGRPV